MRHRTAEEVEKEATVGMAELRDPEADHERTKKPEWVVVVGICTHLGQYNQVKAAWKLHERKYERKKKKTEKTVSIQC